MKRHQLVIGLAFALIASWLIWLVWFDGAGDDDVNFTNVQSEGESLSPSETDPLEHGVSPTEGDSVEGSRLEGEQSQAGGDPPRTDLPWWENEILLDAYYAEFAAVLADAKKSDAVTGLEESLDELRSVEPALLESWGLSAIDWAALGELSKSYQVQNVLVSLRTMRDVELATTSYDSQRFYIDEEPFLVSPQSLVTLLAERTVALDEAQLRELEGIYWGALGERARAEDNLKFARSADKRARRLVGEKHAGIRTLPSLPPELDLLPSELSHAASIKSEVNAAYTSQLLFFLRRNGF